MPIAKGILKKNEKPNNMTKNLTNYINYLQDKNLSPNTISLYLTTLAKFQAKFKHLTTENIKEYFKANLTKYQATSLKVERYCLNSYIKFKKLKVEWEKIARIIPQTQRKFFDTINETELKKLKESRVEKNENIWKRNNLILDFLFYSGVRINELINLKHSDWQGNQCRVHGKGNKVRFILLPDFLITLFNSNSNDYLFTNQQERPIKAEYIRWLLKVRSEQAGIKKRITPHTFRRSFATLLYQRKAGLMTIQKLLGHSSVQTTEGYIQNDWDYINQDYSKLWKNIEAN